MYRIAIQPDLIPENAYCDRWIPRLRELGHHVEVVSLLDHDFIERVNACDGFLWWFPPIPRVREVGKVLLPALDQGGQVFVHPNLECCWHFDDKIAQAYLMRAAGVPSPRTWVFWRYEHAIDFFRTAAYPLVMKLPWGVRSENVALLRDEKEARRMARRMFGSGAESLHPRPFERLRVGLRPLRNLLRTMLNVTPLMRPAIHRNAMLVQEFVPGNEFDVRVNIIGRRAFAFRRANRPNDFRASGSRIQDDDPAKIALDVIECAFDAAQRLKMPAVCFDVLRQNGKPVITEFSYYFNAPTIGQCPGHWLRDGLRDGLCDASRDGVQLQWVDGKMRAEDAVLDDFLERLALRPTSFRNKF